MSQNTPYPLAGNILFWLLWIVGLLVLLMFGSFLLMTAMDAPLMAGWDALVVLAEGWLMFKTARHFIRADKSVAELLLLAALMAIGIPLLASGGCLVVDQMGGGFRFAG
jgi:hypothetical protein